MINKITIARHSKDSIEILGVGDVGIKAIEKSHPGIDHAKIEHLTVQQYDKLINKGCKNYGLIKDYVKIYSLYELYMEQ